jgi:hypothetical protein
MSYDNIDCPEGEYMSTTFKEFLDQKKAQSQEGAKLDLQRWKVSIDKLLTTIEAWLRASDPAGEILQLQRGRQLIQEANYPDYDVPKLRIIVGRDFVDITPEALQSLYYQPRNGSIHIMRSAGVVSVSNGYQAIHLYRQDEKNDEWLLIDHDRNQVKKLEREVFESKLKELLA